MNALHAAENEIERRPLFKLTARLSADDFACPLPNGWTVGTKLAHLAFWDRYYFSLVEGWERTGFISFRPSVDATNEAVRALSRAIPQESVVQLVCGAAEDIDRKVQTLSSELESAIEANGYSRILRRALHRHEHLNQIESALGW